MKLIIKLLLNAVAVFVISYLLRNNGVELDNYLTAIIVAVVLSVLNLFVKPILVILTLPITIVTLGLFLLIINAIIILLADKLIDGFSVSSIWIAVLFSILLSVLQSILHSLLKEDKK
ncbi:phage holin family protein [Sabulilitoribacter arenilitoris]|uniref:Phage holin family protein n=1 Tax=Wocania arenilitoris TaxID=2044858 RepID=A0AAE3ENZ4_9FLAO|nr:phage holin family protein [Wocania arenilitoris]MCF7568332.1 phage holin family protein [Wocania arenilitoris]